MKYIYINSINEIDTKRIAIGQIGKRYIDKEGHRFTTRFNLSSRKVEIVRLAATMEEAMRVRAKILRERWDNYDSIEIDDINENHLSESNNSSGQSKMETISSESMVLTTPVIGESDAESSGNRDSMEQVPAERRAFHTDPLKDYDPYRDDFNFLAPEEISSPAVSMEKTIGEAFYENRFVEETAKELEKMEDRLHAIVNTTKKTKLFEIYGNDDFFESIRKMDTEARSKVAGTLNQYKEIHFYPRPMSYYQARLNDDLKQKLDQIQDESEKMKKVKRWELQETFYNTYDTIVKNANSTLNTLNEVIRTGMADIPATQQQMITNAATSCELLIEDCSNRLETITYWQRTHD